MPGRLPATRVPLAGWVKLWRVMVVGDWGLVSFWRRSKVLVRPATPRRLSARARGWTVTLKVEEGGGEVPVKARVTKDSP